MIESTRLCKSKQPNSTNPKSKDYHYQTQITQTQTQNINTNNNTQQQPHICSICHNSKTKTKTKPQHKLQTNHGHPKPKAKAKAKPQTKTKMKQKRNKKKLKVKVKLKQKQKQNQTLSRRHKNKRRRNIKKHIKQFNNKPISLIKNRIWKGGPSLAQITREKRNLYSNDYKVQLKAVSQLRVWLSNEEQAPLNLVQKNSCVPQLIKMLQVSKSTKLLFETAWVLTNICSGSRQEVMAVIQAGGIETVLNLFNCADIGVIEQAIWVLGNIAGDGYEARDICLQKGAIKEIIQMVSPPEDRKLIANTNAHCYSSTDNNVRDEEEELYTQRSLSPKPQINLELMSDLFVRNLIWSVSNLCRGKPSADWQYIKHVIPLMMRCISSKDADVLVDCCWTLSYITDGCNMHIQTILDTAQAMGIDLPKRLISFLDEPQMSVLVPALRTCGNIVSGSDSQTQEILDKGLLDKLGPLLDHRNKAVLKEAIWTVSNIAAGNPYQIGMIRKSGIFRTIMLRTINKNMELDLLKESIWSLSNATTGGDCIELTYLVQFGAFPLISVINNVECDLKLKLVLLEGLDNLLHFCERHFVPFDIEWNFNTINENVCGEAFLHHSGTIELEIETETESKSYDKDEHQNQDQDQQYCDSENDVIAPFPLRDEYFGRDFNPRNCTNDMTPLHRKMNNESFSNASTCTSSTTTTTSMSTNEIKNNSEMFNVTPTPNSYSIDPIYSNYLDSKSDIEHEIQIQIEKEDYKSESRTSTNEQSNEIFDSPPPIILDSPINVNSDTCKQQQQQQTEVGREQGTETIDANDVIIDAVDINSNVIIIEDLHSTEEYSSCNEHQDDPFVKEKKNYNLKTGKGNFIAHLIKELNAHLVIKEWSQLSLQQHTDTEAKSVKRLASTIIAEYFDSVPSVF